MEQRDYRRRGSDAYASRIESEADRQPGMVRDPSDRHQDTRHERRPVGGVMADRERLALTAEDDLLVRDEAGQPDRVDPDAAQVAAADAGSGLGRRARPGFGRAAATASAVAAAVPDGASALPSWCSSMISTAGRYRAACAANRCISAAPIAKFGATNTPTGASRQRRRPRRNRWSRRRCAPVLDRPRDVLGGELGVGEVDRDLDAGLEERVQVLGEHDIGALQPERLGGLLPRLRTGDRRRRAPCPRRRERRDTPRRRHAPWRRSRRRGSRHDSREIALRERPEHRERHRLRQYPLGHALRVLEGHVLERASAPGSRSRSRRGRSRTSRSSTCGSRGPRARAPSSPSRVPSRERTPRRSDHPRPRLRARDGAIRSPLAARAGVVPA